MTIKEQLIKLKENWLIVLIILVVMIFFLGGSSYSYFGGGQGFGSALTESLGNKIAQVGYPSVERSDVGSYYPHPGYGGGFAPNEKERFVIKNANLVTEVKRGTFFDADSKLKSIVKSSEAFITYESVNKYDIKVKSYYYGSYQIRVEVSKYEDVLKQLRDIGEIQSFNEDANDVTQTRSDLKTQLEDQRGRLERYKKLYEEATSIADKIELENNIYSVEQEIKYLEDSLNNLDETVQYSTIYLTIQEKRSQYADIVFVKFGDLIARLVASLNSVLSLVFVVLPYAVLAWLIWFVFRKFKKKKR
ncbi:MAG: DUF4349 domain-containing protein [Candidatus Woesearchaeota archaeon]|nr:MAG: DUF4349 domain-containing protein [Candidatus Woesearchaeota archaeon]